MELKEFVSETLKQIVDGVLIAQQNIKDKGGTINPPGITTGHSGAIFYAHGSSQPTVQMIDFDVSLIATQDSEAKGGIGVFFGGIGVGVQGKSDTGSSSTNRVKFSVPLQLPISQSSN